MNGHECRHINAETAFFFPQTCKQVCASVRNIGFMFWGQSTLLEQKHNLNLRPSLGANIQDHRTCYKPWKSTPRPPLVRKQMQLINLSFPVSVCNKPTTSYNMINQKKRYQIQISSYSRSCHCSTISTKIWKHFGILQEPHSEPRRWQKKRDNAPDHPNRIGVATYCFENDGQD